MFPLLRASQYRALAAMYLSQSLPAGLAFAAMGVLIRDAGYDVADVGWASLAFLPWAFRFLWASGVDNACRRRGHGCVVFAFQVVSVLTCIALAPSPPGSGLAISLGGVVVLNALAASQGIATNGYAVARMQGAASGPVNAIQVAGFGAGMLMGGGGFLVLYEHWEWSATICAMAALLAVLGLLLWLDRGWYAQDFDKGALESRAIHLRDLFRHTDLWVALGVALSFKIASSALNTLAQPWFVDRGLDLSHIGGLQMAVLSCTSIGGVVIGVPLIRRWGNRRALLGMSAVVAVLMGAGWVMETFSLREAWMYYLAFGTLGVCEGAQFVTAWALLMNWASPEHPGTDYATLQCSESMAGMAAGSIGAIAQNHGYTGAFALIWITGLITVALMAWCLPRMRLHTEPAAESSTKPSLSHRHT